MVNNCNVRVLYKSIFSKKVYIFWTRIFFLYLAWTANIRLGGTVWLAARTLKTKSGFFVFQLDAQETVRLKKDFFEKKNFFCVSDASPRLNFFLRSLSRGANVIKTFCVCDLRMFVIIKCFSLASLYQKVLQSQVGSWHYP